MTPKKAIQPQGSLVCINIPEADFVRDPHTRKELVRAVKNDRASRIANEFDRGLQFIKKYPKSITIYGSARFGADNEHCKNAYDLAFKISKDRKIYTR